MGVKGARLGLITFLLSVLVSASTVLAAEPFDITIQGADAYVWAGQTLKYQATVTNNGNNPVIDIQITNDYGRTAWISLSTPQLTLGNGQSGNVTFYITPTEDALEGLYTFKVKATSNKNPSLSTIKNVDIYVRQKTQLEIQTVKTSKESYLSGEPVDIILVVKNTGSRESDQTKVSIDVKGRAGQIFTDTIPPLRVDKSYVISKQFVPDKYAAGGSYTVAGVLLSLADETLKQKTALFTIVEGPFMKRLDTTTGSLLVRTVQITETNEGNKEGVATITQPLFGPSFLYEFKEAPAKTADGYTWQCTLKPEESCTITYKINYWVFLVLGAVVLAALIGIWAKMQAPALTKRGYRQGKEHSIHLEFKNRSRRTLQNVEVRDLVPTILVVGNQFSIKPAYIRTQKNGTMLVWNLGTMKPGEEKILSYKVRSQLAVEGSIKLPKATISALNTKGKRYNGISSPLHVE